MTTRRLALAIAAAVACAPLLAACSTADTSAASAALSADGTSSASSAASAAQANPAPSDTGTAQTPTLKDASGAAGADSASASSSSSTPAVDVAARAMQASQGGGTLVLSSGTGALVTESAAQLAAATVTPSSCSSLLQGQLLSLPDGTSLSMLTRSAKDGSTQGSAFFEATSDAKLLAAAREVASAAKSCPTLTIGTRTATVGTFTPQGLTAKNSLGLTLTVGTSTQVQVLAYDGRLGVSASTSIDSAGGTVVDESAAQTHATELANAALAALRDAAN